MSNLQKNDDNTKETNPATILLIVLAVLLIPLLFAGFLFQ
jgi:hypothetical protein